MAIHRPSEPHRVRARRRAPRLRHHEPNRPCDSDRGSRRRALETAPADLGRRSGSRITISSLSPTYKLSPISAALPGSRSLWRKAAGFLSGWETKSRLVITTRNFIKRGVNSYLPNSKDRRAAKSRGKSCSTCATSPSRTQEPLGACNIRLRMVSMLLRLDSARRT